MGLDMFAYTVNAAPADPVDFPEPDDKPAELFYWRKHPDLHGWMQRLYRDKGGTDPLFNLSPLVLTADDLRQLEQDVVAGHLPKTTGFSFGKSSSADKLDDIEFIAKARAAIAAGKTVFYTAWF